MLSQDLKWGTIDCRIITKSSFNEKVRLQNRIIFQRISISWIRSVYKEDELEFILKEGVIILSFHEDTNSLTLSYLSVNHKAQYHSMWLA